MAVPTPTPTPPTPTTLSGFTPRWLTETLRANGVISAATTVTGVDHQILGQGEGFMGILARLSLGYDGPAGPASVIVKIPTDVDANRAGGRAIGVYEREVRFYSEVLPNLDFPKPAVYTAIYEADGHEEKLRKRAKMIDRLPFFLLRWFARHEQGKSDVPPCVLLLEDLDHVAVGDQVAGGTPEQMAAALRVLARIHAQTWNKRHIPNASWADGPDTIPRLMHALYLNGREEFLRQAAPHFSAHSTALYESLADTGVERVLRHLDEVPQCLVHGDYRLDNMFFADDGSVAAVIDWQTATSGPGVIDVGYFLASSLAADAPESLVDELLGAYHSELVTNGVTGYSYAQFVDDYVDGLLIVLHRLTGIADVLDLGDGRGATLMERWLQRTDARLQRVPTPEPATSRP